MILRSMTSGEQIEVTYYLNDVSDDLSQVLMTYNDDGVYDTAYTYGIERVGIDILDNTRPVSQNPLYYLYDGLGSVSYITKPDGEIRDTYKYDEFGKPRGGKLSPDGDKILHNEFGYTGEQWDEEAKLQYLRARYYDPEVGRFINRDTYEGEVENPLSKNLYAYVQNNPVNYSDPSGHWKTYVFYYLTNPNDQTSGFGSQAWNSPYFDSESQNTNMIQVTTVNDFVIEWNKMGNDAGDVYLYVHGGHGMLYFLNSRLDSVGKGWFKEDNKWIFSMTFKMLNKKTIHGNIYLLSCYGGQGEEGKNVAWMFAKLTGAKVVANEGKVSYTLKRYARTSPTHYGKWNTYYYQGNKAKKTYRSRFWL